ncbi:HAD superfamily hydrolase (TIGR01450 family) [Azospirillum agricola]|uniref:HAD-IIA family hydrolase n=1 Tax=Azospirillum agricola TaxID=1720247 RepID=UPI001AE5F9BB|nr:HAD hydrolase-like protein [Azospirillum agricola]MBP2233426.1 HAD superfamily hydrolase (TIGR01450 family) [Azospirillum agricola]
MRSVNLSLFLEPYDTLLVDVDGVLTHHGEFSDAAMHALKTFRSKNIFICTNSVRRTPSIIASRLASLGLSIPADDVFTGARAAVAFLRRLDNTQKVYLFGCGSASEYFIENGISVHDEIDKASAFVLGAIDAQVMNVEACTKIANRHLDGAITVATSEDLVVPHTDGSIKLGTGFLSKFIKSLSDTNYALVGKPSRSYFETVLSEVKARGGGRAVMIGDTYSTDIVGAHSMGLDTLYVTRQVTAKPDAYAHGVAVAFAMDAEVFVND